MLGAIINISVKEQEIPKRCHTILLGIAKTGKRELS